jgi:hypothetical protein
MPRGVTAATETLAGAKTTAPGMCVGTVVLCVVGTGVTRRRAPGRRFSRRLGLCRRWHDDFYLGICVEDVLGLCASFLSQGTRERFRSHLPAQSSSATEHEVGWKNDNLQSFSHT